MLLLDEERVEERLEEERILIMAELLMERREIATGEEWLGGKEGAPRATPW